MLALVHPISTIPHRHGWFSFAIETALPYTLYKFHELTKCVVKSPRRGLAKERQSDVFVEDSSVVATR